MYQSEGVDPSPWRLGLLAHSRSSCGICLWLLPQQPHIIFPLNVTFEGGLVGQVVDPGTVTSDATYVTNNPTVELRKNGVLLATYRKSFKKNKSN